jgi:hypothetical protein
MYSEDQLQHPKRSGSEDQLQAQIVTLTRNNYDCIIFSIPNGGFRNKLEASKLKATGLLAGIPDLIITYNEHQNDCGGGIVFIELKTEKGKLSEQQELIHRKLRSHNHRVFIIRTLQEYQELLTTLQVPLKVHKLQQSNNQST